MQQYDVKSENKLCIPPPPPLPPAAFPPLKVPFTLNRKQCLAPKKSSRDDVVSALRHITHHFDIENPGTLISVYNPVSPVLQNGRCCGIVALSMASQLICDASVENILSAAKSLNFTKEGEMFSAHNMAALAKYMLKCHTVVLNDLKEHKLDILSHICCGYPALIPYDADKNHFPCVNHGLSAHWAVVTGLCFSISVNKHPRLLEHSEKISEFPELNIYVINDGMLAMELLQYAEKIFLYAHQGKSRHLSAWDLNDVFKSNENMYEITKKYSSDDLVLPENDYLSELRNKIVLLKREKECSN